jgi:hypothetical protein
MEINLTLCGLALTGVFTKPRCRGLFMANPPHLRTVSARRSVARTRRRGTRESFQIHHSTVGGFMKILTACVLAAIGLSAVSWAQAANSDKAIVWREWIDTVTPAHELACEAAQESFVQRLREPREFSFPAVTH